MNIQGFQKTTLLDYPGKVAGTVFFGGCNFRCPFCHNGDLVLYPHQNSDLSETGILEYLKKRSKILDGVCLTGGEPSLQPRLAAFLDRIKDLGLAVKLDTNGYRPDVLQDLCSKKLVDYIAMDIKGSPASYAQICGLDDLDFSRITASVDFLLEGRTAYEFRTTVVRELHSMQDFYSIGEWLQGASSYYLQGYQESPQVISPGFSSYTRAELEEIQVLLQKYIPAAAIRGVEH